jgi:hypothetical protein
MTSRFIPLGTFLICVAWAIAILCQVSDFVFGPHAGRLGVLFALAAVSIQLCEKIDGMERREKAAFELGRESVRSIR